MLSMSDQAFASSECGVPSTSGNPYVASCLSDPGQYQNGITYNDASYATPTGLKIDIYGTAIVAPINNATAVSVTGTANNGAIISVRNGARITSGGNGLVSATSGTGTALVDNHGSVTSGGIALSAAAGGTGASTIINESDGTVLVTNGTNAALANGGSASITNLGTISSTSTLTGSTPFLGLAATSTGAGSTLTITNAGSASFVADHVGVTGLASLGSSGAVTLGNTGTLSVNARAGAAMGLYVAAAGTPGAVAVGSSGLLTVSGGTSAVGMDVEQGTSAALTLQQASASGGITVSAANLARGLVIGNASGAQSVSVTGGLLQVATTADGSLATGISLNGGTTQTVGITSNYAGGLYKGDVAVTAGGAGSTAQGMVMNGASGNVGATLTNASLTVQSLGGSATGITISGGANVSVGTSQNATNSSSAAILVNAGGNAATGIAIANASGTETVALGDALTVRNTLGGAAGLTMGGGTSQSASFAVDVKVEASGGAAYGVDANGSGGAVGITAQGALAVYNHAGSATGILVGSGVDQTIQLAGALDVQATGAAAGVSLSGTGALAVALQGTSGVISTNGAAAGVQMTGGTSQTLTLGKALTVQSSGADARGLDLANGLATVHLNAPITVSSDTGAAYGLADNGGSGLAVDGIGAITAGSAGDAYGVYSHAVAGAQALTLGTITATSTGGQAYGVSLAGSGQITLSDAGTITAHGANNGAAVQITLSGAATPQSITAHVATVNATGNGVGGVWAEDDTGNVAVTATTVNTTGINAYGVIAVSGGVLSTVSAGTVTTTGAGSLGIGVESAGDGGAAQVIANSVSTTGDQATGVIVVGAGAGTTATATLGTVTTTGAYANGVQGFDQSGALSITATQVSVAGPGAVGVQTQDASGATTIQTATVTAGAGASYAIQAASDTGSITINTATTSAASADAIHAQSNSGAVIVNLADGGATTGGAAGVAITTGGTATINLGNAAGTATLSGATAGISSSAAGGQTVNLRGTVGAGNGQALALSGGASTVNNSGTINGYVALTGSSNTVNNTGTWNAYAGDSTFAGLSTVNNSGTINVFPAATLASGAGATLRMTGLTTLNNSGTINLANGRTGDVLSVSGAVVGSGSSRLVVDANLSSVSLAGAAAGTADQLAAGSVSGKTTLVVNDLGAAKGGAFNFGGIRVITSASIAPGSVVLQGGPIIKGFASYQLLSDAAGNLDLVGLPSSSAFEMVRTATEAQKYWRRSADAWAGQMQALDMSRGSRMWLQVYGGDQTDKSRPVYGATVLNQSVSFTPNLDIDHSWTGAQLGYQLGRDSWAVGLTGGYGYQRGRLQATRDEIKLTGGNFGAYARVQSGGAYANVLAKVDRYHVTYALSALANAPGFYGTTYGIDLRGGYRLAYGQAFVEPQVGLSWTHSDLDGFGTPSGDMAVAFHHTESVFGSLGLKAGLETRSGAWGIRPYVAAAYEGEMNGTARTVLSSGGTSLDYGDASEGGHARIEAGVQASSRTLSVFGKVEGVAGSKARGIGGSAGLSLRF